MFYIHEFIPESASIGVWQGVAMDALKFYSDPPCPTVLRPTGRLPLKWPYSRFCCGPPAGLPAACGHLLRFRTPHAVHPCLPAPKRTSLIFISPRFTHRNAITAIYCWSTSALRRGRITFHIQIKRWKLCGSLNETREISRVVLSRPVPTL
jgi:hypothetical protein